MRMGSLRGAGLVAGLVIGGVLWLYGHGGGATPTRGPSYCADVDRLSSVLTDVRQSGNGSSQAATLASIGSALQRDAAGQVSSTSAAAASLTALAADVAQWRQAIVANDAVNETIALDRILSGLSSVPGC
jgi:hypothetical protein